MQPAIRHKSGTERQSGAKTKKPADRKVMQAFDLYTIYIGGYGWTRTTDPGIMSAVL